MHEDGFLYIAIYVDDVESELFLELLKEKFKITFGSLENFFEMQIKCQSDGAIFVSKDAYMKNILKKFNKTKTKVVSMPEFAKKVTTTKTSAPRFHIVRQWTASPTLRQKRAMT
jgi:hypothetical protein